MLTCLFLALSLSSTTFAFYCDESDEVCIASRSDDIRETIGKVSKKLTEQNAKNGLDALASLTGYVHGMATLAERLLSLQPKFRPWKTEKLTEKVVGRYDVWLQQNMDMHEGIRVELADNGVPVLMAIESLAKGEIVMNIPMQFVLETSIVSDRFKRCSDRQVSDGGFAALEIIRATKKEELAPWIDVLPRLPYVHPMYWMSLNRFLGRQKLDYKPMMSQGGGPTMQKTLKANNISHAFTMYSSHLQTTLADYVSIKKAMWATPKCKAFRNIRDEDFTLSAFMYSFTIALTQGIKGSNDELLIIPGYGQSLKRNEGRNVHLVDHSNIRATDNEGKGFISLQTMTDIHDGSKFYRSGDFHSTLHEAYELREAGEERTSIKLHFRLEDNKVDALNKKKFKNVNLLVKFVFDADLQNLRMEDIKDKTTLRTLALWHAMNDTSMDGYVAEKDVWEFLKYQVDQQIENYPYTPKEYQKYLDDTAKEPRFTSRITLLEMVLHELKVWNAIRKYIEGKIGTNKDEL